MSGALLFAILGTASGVCAGLAVVSPHDNGDAVFVMFAVWLGLSALLSAIAELR